MWAWSAEAQTRLASFQPSKEAMHNGKREDQKHLFVFVNKYEIFFAFIQPCVVLEV